MNANDLLMSAPHERITVTITLSVDVATWSSRHNTPHEDVPREVRELAMIKLQDAAMRNGTIDIIGLDDL